MRLLLIGLFVISVSYAGSISGYVADSTSGVTIIGVNVMLENSSYGASTDRNGFFVINNIPTGKYTLWISHIAYAEKRIPVEIKTTNIYLKTIFLKPSTLEGEAITVSANRGNLINKDTDISSFEVDPIILREVPQFGKDVFKLIKYSPSVTVSDMISPLYYVRGSDPGENLVQLDGMTIYNPQHALSLDAIFNPYSIKNIEMLVGGFGAEYGGRNASILYLTTREGHKDKIKGEFRPSASGLQGAIEFPAFSNGTAMISGRMLTDLISHVAMGMTNGTLDLNGTYQTHVGNSKLRFSGFYARDYIDYDFARFSLYFSDPAMRNYSNGFLTSTSNKAIGLQSRTILTPNLVAEGHLYFSGFGVDNKNFFHFTTRDTVNNVDVVLDYETRIQNSVSDLTVKGSLSWFTFLNQTIKLGFEQNSVTFTNQIGSGTTEANEENINLQSVFLEDKFETDLLLIKYGARQSRLSNGNWRLEPRASLVLKFGEIRLKGAWGKYHQYITAMNTQDVEISQYLDYYYPLIDKVPLTSIHNIIGIEGKVFGDFDYSITGYFKDLTTVYRFDYQSESESAYAYNASLEKGSGIAKGLELLLRGSWRNLSGWISYSWSESMRSFPSLQSGKSYFSDGDQTHSISTMIMAKLTRDITASTTFKFSSGYPRTWEAGNINHYSYDPVTNSFGIFPEQITSEKNNVRYPSHLVWDIGWKKKLRSGFGFQIAEFLGTDKAWFTMSVKNLLFLKRNPYLYFYIPEFGYYGMGISYVPTASVGYSIEF